jgi:hypothetical protein
MSKYRFTPEQMKCLLENKNVANCSDKTIAYAKEFKLQTIERYHREGIPVRQIFKEAGFDLNVIGREKPDKCLNRWNKTFKVKGAIGLLNERRGKGSGGGRPKTKGLTDAEKIERLEATVAYLKAENDFLAKLRSGKAE